MGEHQNKLFNWPHKCSVELRSIYIAGHAMCQTSATWRHTITRQKRYLDYYFSRQNLDQCSATEGC